MPRVRFRPQKSLFRVQINDYFVLPLQIEVEGWGNEKQRNSERETEARTKTESQRFRAKMSGSSFQRHQERQGLAAT